MPEPAEDAPQGVPIMVDPEMFAGKWANVMTLQRSPHEFTLDFMRLGPQGQQGILVARVSFSQALLGELAELVQAHWNAYTQEAGIPPEDGFPSQEGDDD